MGNSAIRMVLLSAIGLALGSALAACASDDNKEPDPNILPTNYKQDVLDTMTRLLADPTNVRDAYISEPALTPGSQDKRYAICVRYNARNENRQYVGSKDRIGYFYAGRLNQLIEADKDQCARAAYKPFPELENLCRAKVCN
jgi:hypothetical protein